MTRNESVIEVRVNSTIISTKLDDRFNVWFNNEDESLAEAACVRMFDNSTEIRNDYVSCTNRIITKHQNIQGNYSTPNVLSILIDPISREQFRQKLPRTSQLLRDLNFSSFHQHTVVGGNSGPNQAAIFSGIPLSNGRNGIHASASHGNSKGNKQSNWIWDELRDQGYVTFKGEDSCILNSNMIQSIKPNVTHGSALHEMFCFAFERPNCLGDKLAASHLLTAADQFINAYSEATPWAAFISFTDSHEDSMSLIQLLDNLLFDFVSKIEFSKTLVIIQSDHGLHYGPYFQSITGERERAQPVLSVRLPDSFSQNIANLEENTHLWTSPFDVYETIVDVVFKSTSNPSGIGSSLMKPLPTSRRQCSGSTGIPSEYCDKVNNQYENNFCKSIPLPPTPLSFFADIADYNDIQLPARFPLIKFGQSPVRNKSWRVPKETSCMCATDISHWRDCKSHPWKQNIRDTSTVALMYCNTNYDVSGVVYIDIRLTSRKQKSPKKFDMFTSLAMLSDADQVINRSLLCSNGLLSLLDLPLNNITKRVNVQYV